MENTFTRKFTLAELDSVAEKLLADNPEARLVAFYGSMGVGKTTLIKAICNQLKVKDIVGSPTFSIVNQYLTQSGEVLHHFDFYRMKKLEEAYDIGYEDYFYGGNYCFLEWPEKIEELLPDECLKIFLEEDNGARVIRYTKSILTK